MDGLEKTLRRGAREVRDTADRRGGEARQELSRLWDQLENTFDRHVAPATAEGAQQAMHYAKEGRDVAYDLAGRLSDAARARPLLAIGLTVATTWLVTALLTPKRR